MKLVLIPTFVQIVSSPIPRNTALLITALFLAGNASAYDVEVDMGSASAFAVHAGTGITNTGPTTINGHVGSYPTTSITGFETVTHNGTNHGGDSVSQAAKIDFAAAYADAAARTPTLLLGPAYELGGSSRLSGVYNGTSSLAITGTLTLDAAGDPNSVWIFQAGSTLTTASNSSVNLINGAQASNVFWQVGSSATLGTGTDFSGSILAFTSITLTTGAEIQGNALALNGAVTMDSNFINTVPEPSSMLLLGSGLLMTLAFTRRSSRCRSVG